MEKAPAWTPADLDQFTEMEIPQAEAETQLGFFTSPPPPPALVRSCRLDDGVRQISPDRHQELEDRWAKAAKADRLLKFVPASGAATRMFRDLQESGSDTDSGSEHEPAGAAPDGNDQAPAVLAFIEALPRLALIEPLRATLGKAGLSLDELIGRGDTATILSYLLGPAGLAYQEIPKGLVAFHNYPTGSRTAFEEHLVESSHFLSQPGGVCRLHFTVARRHTEAFADQLEQARQRYEKSCDARFEVSFSVQKRSTDTLAVDHVNRPFRLDDRSLLFRPAGHGALLRNLNHLEADVVFIKNIDNISPESRHAASGRWKRILAGHLLTLQEEIFTLLESLESEYPDPQAVSRAYEIFDSELVLKPPDEILRGDLASRSRYAKERLDRPLRVCGVVAHEGGSGGGPFWIAETDGGLSGQIIEAVQVDGTSPEQKSIWSSSTHFNPVDLVCGPRDRHGRSHDLGRYVDPATVFITEKSHYGHRLKALERPGLWNGAMANWNTVFVEVPPETFTPVKTVWDLLKPEHQAGGE